MGSCVRISVMICTKDREKDVKGLLGNLAEQTCRPDQVIVVDASQEDVLSGYLASTTFPFEHRYIRAEPGVMRQRNMGIDNCDGEFIVCLDDDLILMLDFVEEMLKPFHADLDHRLSAVTGRIVENQSWLESSPLRARLNHRLRQFVIHAFLLDKVGSGRFRYSGLPTYSRDERESRYVECVPGGCVVYRRQVFDQFRYDETFFYPPLDDMDISKWLLDGGHKVYYQASACVLHKKSPSGRPSRYNLYRVWVTHYNYLFRKHWPQTALRKLAFWWSMAGMLVLNASWPEQFRGILSGIANIQASKTPLDAMNNLLPKT